MRVSIFLIMLLFLAAASLAQAKQNCALMEGQKVKVEAWLSKKYEPDLKDIAEEFAAMGNTRVSLWVYPAENPSETVAIGRCVPAYIARHLLIQALKYSKGVSSLVHQGFVSSYWMGVGTSLFADNSQNKITGEQLMQLMGALLDTEKFQKLYREFTVQKETVKGFGLELPNPKYLHH